MHVMGFPDSSVGEESTCNAGHPGSIPGLGRSAGEEIDYLLQYSWAPLGSAGKESACNVGDLGLIPGLERSLGEGKGCPLQYSGLENSMKCIVHGVATERLSYAFLGLKVLLLKMSVLPWWLRWSRIYLQNGRPGFDPWVGKIPWRRAWQPTPVFLPGESPWSEEPGGLQSIESQRVGQD